MRRVPAAARRAALAGAALLMTLACAAPASAHPFGPPPTAVVRVQDGLVVIHWDAAQDDMLALGERLGVLPPGSVEAVQDGVTQVAPPAASEAALDTAPALAEYLRERIAVFQDGERCTATVERIVDFVARGATTVHRCPTRATRVQLRITMLHDIHDAYRTFAVAHEDTPAASPGQSVHTVRSPEATWDFTGAASGSTDDGGALGPFEGDFLKLIDAPSPAWWFTIVALLLAAGIGAAHALAPGHGKAVAAAYLVGARGRPRDAVLLGGAVAAMHTLSVVVLALALHALAAGGGRLDRLGPWLTLASGVLVLAVGVGSSWRVLRHRAGGHGHGDAQTHTHTHTPDVSPLSRRGLVLIGVSGGLLPSPSAFLVLTTALFTGRTLFGLALVAAFSLGLAATLTVIGLAVLRGRDIAARRSARNPRLVALLDAVPLASALLITIAGAWLTTLAVTRLA